MRGLFNNILRSCGLLSAFLLVTVVAAVVQRDVNTQLITPATDQNLTWWQTAIFYQVYPRSFKDSNGDGVGDIQGIISELDYFVDLGVDCIWLSPVYKSPMRDFGYDISDYKDVDPIFGTLDDFRELIQEIHKRGLKFISDFVPGHVSSDHEWFRRSVKRDGKYTNYFVWSDGKLLDNGTRVPPNNWLSVFGGSAWSWNDERQQYYYHAFDPHQIDLNYRDQNLQWEIKDTFRFWLDYGVDGFRIDAFSQLFENENTSLDEPLSGNNVPPTEYAYLNHIYTADQPDSLPILTSWKNVVDDYSKQDGKVRYLVVELYAPPNVRNKIYGVGAVPFNFDLISMGTHPTGRDIFSKVMDEYINLPSGKWPNFVLGNHDQKRLSYRYGAQYVNVFNILLLTLWGTPTTYYGEELGMLSANISWENTVDPQGLGAGPERYQLFTRDPSRTPMQWSNDFQAGFSTGNTTWLPLAENWATLNVKTENSSSQQTPYKLYRQLAHLRKNQAFQTGTFRAALVTDNIVSYLREGTLQRYLVIMNFGQETTDDYRNYGGPAATVVAITPGLTGVQEGQRLSLDALKLEPGQGVVLLLDQDFVPTIG
ncbi:maltase 1 [Biomphalaria glabrata]|uniref:Maltase 2-like n=1 Tax=Biomphalaria glabrata TaxID=6526 RepID=A0A9W2Z1T2_BIOGL|nr:maltase 2-like [Biomphalaria glabrata]